MHNKAVNRTFFVSLRFGVASPLYPKTPLHKKCPLQRVMQNGDQCRNEKSMFILGLLMSINAFASYKTVTLEPSEFSKIRVFANTYSTAGAQRMVTIYHALSGGCDKGLWFNPEDNPEMYSMLLAAYMGGKEVELRYSPADGSPWNDSAWCRLEWISIIK